MTTSDNTSGELLAWQFIPPGTAASPEAAAPAAEQAAPSVTDTAVAYRTVLQVNLVGVQIALDLGSCRPLAVVVWADQHVGDIRVT